MGAFYKGLVNKLKDKNFRTSDEHHYDQSDFLYSRKGPWPQPSPVHPWGEAPAVIHLPLREKVDWWIWIGSRYLATLPLSLPYYIYACLKPGLEVVDDNEFENMLNYSMVSKFITDKLDDIDKDVFRDFLNGQDDFFIIDFEAVNVVKTFKGIYASGSKTLLKKVGDEYKVIAISIDKTKEVFVSDDGDAWTLAKYFMLQGAALCSTLVMHPLLHFPFDSINAISKTSLPKDHVLYRLLSPHFRFTLPLENAVLNYKSSLLQEKWWMTYAPYPGGPSGLRDLLVEGYKGIKGNDSYPPFSYSMGRPKALGKYGEYLRSYNDCIYKYVEKILGDVEKGDFWIARWADYVNKHVPHFPASDTIFEGDNLVRAVTTYIYTVTVAHSTDHYNYGSLNKRKIPLRMRQAPPKKGDKIKSLRKLVRPVDMMKYYMADSLFFSPTTVTKFVNAKYKFKEEYRNTAAKEFKEALKNVDKDLRMRGVEYMPLDKIAASIQF